MTMMMMMNNQQCKGPFTHALLRSAANGTRVKPKQIDSHPCLKKLSQLPDGITTRYRCIMSRLVKSLARLSDKSERHWSHHSRAKQTAWPRLHGRRGRDVSLPDLRRSESEWPETEGRRHWLQKRNSVGRNSVGVTIRSSRSLKSWSTIIVSNEADISDVSDAGLVSTTSLYISAVTILGERHRSRQCLQ